MTALFSAQWHRVAGLRPRLASGTRVRRQRVRGRTWLVLGDELGTRSVRLNRAAYAFAGRLDGNRTVQALWDRLHAHDGDADDAPTQDEAIELLARLREAGLVEFDRPADFAALLPHLDAQRPASRRFGGLSWRMPLLNPTRPLARLGRWTAWLHAGPALALWLAATLALLALALRHADALWAHAATWMHTPRYLLLGIVLYVPVKLLHETAHGLVARRLGAPVREAGVTWMALCMPVPYVDASASAALPRARDRLAVAAAGIMVELVVALAGLVLWLAADDGAWWRDAGFVLFVIGSVSTLLFNANPLQRFDGYYLMCDALGLPNLATRSRRWWLGALRRRLLALPGDDADALVPARGERPWLIAYAPLAWGCQAVVAVTIALWLAGVHWALGAAAAALLAWQQVLRPIARFADELRRLAPRDPRSTRRLHRAALGGVALLVLLPLVPLPRHLTAQGVIWPPDDAQLRAGSDGVVRHLYRRDGDPVAAGELLVELENPTLAARERAQAARVAGLRSDAVQMQSSGGAPASDARGELERAEADLAHTRDRIAGLYLHAARAGRLELPNAGDLVGSHVRQGTLLGQVRDDRGPVLRVALDQTDATGLRERTHGVQTWLADGRGPARAGSVLRDAYGAATQLPSPALGTRGGGAWRTDPTDRDGLRSLQPIVRVDIALAADTRDAPTGLRGWARFDQGMSPAALQLADWAQRAWHRRVDAER